MTSQESQQNEIFESRLGDSMTDVNESTVAPSHSASPAEGVLVTPPAVESYGELSTASSRSQDYKGKNKAPEQGRDEVYSDFPPEMATMQAAVGSLAVSERHQTPEPMGNPPSLASGPPSAQVHWAYHERARLLSHMQPTFGSPAQAAQYSQNHSRQHQSFSSYRDKGAVPQEMGSGSQATVQRAYQQTGTSLSQSLYPSQGQMSFNGIQGTLGVGQQYRGPLNPFPFPQDTPSQGEHVQQQNLTAAGALFTQPLQGSMPRTSAIAPPPAIYAGQHDAQHQKIPRAVSHAAQSLLRPITQASPPRPRPRPESKRHRCRTCRRGFLRLTALEAHEMTHTVERLYPCPFPGCIRHRRPHWFSVQSNLTRHIDANHAGESRSADSEGVVMDETCDEAEEAFAKLKI